MRIPVALTIILLLSACSSTKSPGVQESESKKAGRSLEGGNDVAFYAGGCFWGVEHFLEKLDGVESVDSGYMGGPGQAPTYKQVSSGNSGHLEAVRVVYDNTKISYRDITKRFFEIHDPTQIDGQGPDLGAQYLSAVFYASLDEKNQAQALIDLLTARDFKIATELKEVAKFWPAEDYHQNYYQKSGKQPYCHLPVNRFGE
ncbi:MAG: peptide-methionine (S)-S-oxide reductase MsrA [Kofleriaceae bacterium]|nr:peptide-methionine (S)-S-oxide reductase MsrA [Kofleriaceae bacterium]